MFLEKVLQMLIRMRDVVCFINRIFLNVSREEMNELIPDDRIEIILNNVSLTIYAWQDASLFVILHGVISGL